MSWQPPSPPDPPAAAPSPVVSGEQELRPTAAAYFGDVGKRAAIAVPLVLLLILRNVVSSDRGIGLWATIALVVGTAGVSIALVVTHFRTAVVRLTPGRIEISGALVRNRVLDVAGMRGLLAALAQPMTPPTRTLAVVDRTGQRITLSGSVWSEEDLSAIARHAGAGEDDQVLGASEFERRVPGGLPYWMRRPWMVAAIVVVVLVVVVIVAALALM